MAATENTMDDERFSIDKVLNSLPGRVLLVVVASAGIAVLGSLLLWVNRGVQESVLAWGVVGVIGLVCGLSARWLFPEATAALRLWTALLALLAGLVLLGLTTQGTAGARLPDSAQAGLNWGWLGQFAFGALLAWLAQAAFHALPFPAGGRKRRPAREPAAMPRARAKRASSQGTPEPGGQPVATRRPGSRSAQRLSNENPTARHAPSRQDAPRSARTQPAAPKRPAGRDRQPAAARTAAAPRSRRASTASPDRAGTQAGPYDSLPARPAAVPAYPPTGRQASLGARLSRLGAHLKMRRGEDEAPHIQGRSPYTQRSLRSAPASNSSGQTAPWTMPARRKVSGGSKNSSARGTQPSVRLVGEEEHRCPYCLELVAPHDRRGVVECPICHTRHHADCWAVTGVCQVPHFNG